MCNTFPANPLEACMAVKPIYCTYMSSHWWGSKRGPLVLQMNAILTELYRLGPSPLLLPYQSLADSPSLLLMRQRRERHLFVRVIGLNVLVPFIGSAINELVCPNNPNPPALINFMTRKRNTMAKYWLSAR